MSRSPEPLPTSAFDYSLPRERIARYPSARRDESRLMVVERATGRIEDRTFRDIRSLFAPGDALVLNETRVLPARLLGTRAGGGRAEVLLLRPLTDDESEWEALVRPGARLGAGRVVRVADDLSVEIVATGEGGVRTVRLVTPHAPRAAIELRGQVPLPPYIEREPEAVDTERYQTVYARASGSVAAPTAGLHFTPELLDAIQGVGVSVVRLVLHVGPGTFRPVAVEDPAQHPMHAEWYALDDAAAVSLNERRAQGGRIWAVGTTVARVLETLATEDGVRAGSGWTSLFIRPPYTFRVVDALITNFHLPRSTLLMLVAAFGGYDLIMRAYDEAVQRGYRFYSYGDAMVIH